MTSIKIREAMVEDAPSVSALMGELGYDLSASELEGRIQAYLESSDSVIVADDGGEIVGFLSFHIIPLFHASSNLGRITAMCVGSNRRREGIGRGLLTRLDEIASSCGCVRIEVTSGDLRVDAAHVFYQACGYALDSRRFQRILTQAEKGPARKSDAPDS